MHKLYIKWIFLPRLTQDFSESLSKAFIELCVLTCWNNRLHEMSKLLQLGLSPSYRVRQYLRTGIVMIFERSLICEAGNANYRCIFLGISSHWCANKC